MTRRVLPLLAGLALATPGCGGGGDGGGEPAGQPAGEATSGGGADVTITMRNIAYEPREATAQVGQTVRWVNEDDAAHDVDSTSGPEVKSEVFGKGATFEYEATEAGTIEYFCTIHPQMKATLTVTE